VTRFFQFRVYLYLAIVLAAAVAGGCSDMTAHVDGTVKLDGKPLRIGKSQRGTVLFRPVVGGAMATALIDENGKYSISTGGTAALVPGDYLVAVRATEIVPADDTSAPPTGKPFTPYLYGNPLESGLVCIVKRGKQTYNIELRSDAGPAVVESASEPEPDGESPADDQPTTAGDGDVNEESEAAISEKDSG
jgi:hypothetical protein